MAAPNPKPSSLPEWASTADTVLPWQASTAYLAGDLATNGPNVYEVVTAGTSAGSGGPTGTGQAITDGTVTWRYLGKTGTAGGITEPSAGRKDTGWLAGEKPPHGYFNWLAWLTWKWTLFLDTFNQHLQIWQNAAVFEGPPAWAATTAYVVGEYVLNSGKVYVCTVAGTSAGSGGPTGTGTGITDGTVTWDYAQLPFDVEVPARFRGAVVIDDDASVGGALEVAALTTLTDAATVGDGLTVSRFSAGAGTTTTGNGAGAGVVATGGATGNGGTFAAGATSGRGVSATASGNDAGGVFTGSGTGAGVSATGGATGVGGAFSGGATGGAGLTATGTGGGNGATTTGQGAGHGLSATGGATGNGAVVSGVIGLQATGTGGVGVSGTGSAGQAGATFTNGTAATGATRQTALAVTNGDISLAGVANPNSTVAITNTLTPMHLIKAWARITTTGGGSTVATVNAGSNVSGASVSGNNVTITLAAGLAAANGGVGAMMELTGGLNPFGLASAANTVVINAADMRQGVGAGNPYPTYNFETGPGQTFTVWVLGAQ